MQALDEYRKIMSVNSTPNPSYNINRYKKIVIGQTKQVTYKNGGYQYKSTKSGSDNEKIIVL